MVIKARRVCFVDENGDAYGIKQVGGRPESAVSLLDENGLPYGVRQVGNRPQFSGQLIDENGTPYGVKHVENAISFYNAALNIDGATNALRTITYEHHEVHSGSSFHVGYSVTTPDDDDVTAIMFKTPNTTKWLHLVATFACSDPAEAIILEAPDLADSGDGTDKVVLNRDRNSSTKSTVSSLEDEPTVGSVTTMNEAEWTAVGVTNGTELEHEYLQGGSGPKAVGGVTRGTQEWILKKNTVYVFYLQNTGANANAHSISLDWYEHTNI